MKYQSITTPDVQHDAANMLAEFIWLNSDIRSTHYPWRGADNGRKWGQLVSALKKLMNEPFGLSPEQLAFYIWSCKPKIITSKEFAKMAVVARRLFRRFDLEQVIVLYNDRRNELASSGLEQVQYKQEKPKSLLSFLRELERETEKK